MIILYEELRLTDDDFAHRMEFCELLYTILEPYFPGKKNYFFSLF